jgi:hypothetical protein
VRVLHKKIRMRSLYLVLYRGITYPTFLRCSNITEQRRGEIPCPEPRKVELVGAAGTDVDIINISGHNPIPASLLDQVSHSFYCRIAIVGANPTTTRIRYHLVGLFSVEVLRHILV